MGNNVSLCRYVLVLILSFSADVVPVGADQVQHLEFARECARNFNAVHGAQVLKEPRVILCTFDLPGIECDTDICSTGRKSDVSSEPGSKDVQVPPVPAFQDHPHGQ